MIARVIELHEVFPLDRIIELEYMEKPARIIRRDFVRTKGGGKKTVYTKLCPYCNADFKTSRGHTQYCPDCRTKRHRELHKLRHELFQTIYVLVFISIMVYDHLKQRQHEMESTTSSEG